MQPVVHTQCCTCHYVCAHVHESVYYTFTIANYMCVEVFGSNATLVTSLNSGYAHTPQESSLSQLYVVIHFYTYAGFEALKYQPLIYSYNYT